MELRRAIGCRTVGVGNSQQPSATSFLNIHKLTDGPTIGLPTAAYTMVQLQNLLLFMNMLICIASTRGRMVHSTLGYDR
jgi:hypothetical protein